jgi:hypothetical protein
MVDLDLERASGQIDVLIERRSREAEEVNRVEAAWAESVRKYNLARAAERREAWRAHYLQLASVHEQLAAENRAKASLLVGAGVKGMAG